MKKIKKLTFAGICLALCLLLPLLTGQIPKFGKMLCPMHFPVLLAGFVCGPVWGLLVGLIAPTLRFIIFGMPVIFPMGVAMSFELATYGFLSGFLFSKSKKKIASIYFSLVFAMMGGRIVWAFFRTLLSGAYGSSLTFPIFISDAFVGALPGIILQLILIPFIILSLQKASLVK